MVMASVGAVMGEEVNGALMAEKLDCFLVLKEV
jgi:hypothetical protein